MRPSIFHRPSLKRWAVLAAALLLGSKLLMGAPTISSVEGDVRGRGPVRIHGAGFGVKAVPRPVLWADQPRGGSLDPTPLGLLTRWSDAVNIQATTAGPRPGSLASWSGTAGWGKANVPVSALVVEPSGVVRGTKFYVSFWRRVTYNPDADRDPSKAPQNWKWFRVYNAKSVDYPNFYIGSQVGRNTYNNDINKILYVEPLNPPAPNNRVYPLWPTPGGEWRLEEYFFRLNSRAGAADGYIELLVNGTAAGPVVDAVNKRLLPLTTFQTDQASTPGLPKRVRIQDAAANFHPSSGAAFYSSIYVDTSWDYVVLGDQPTLAASTHREMFIPSAWTDGLITATVFTGSFPVGTTAYLFVVKDKTASPGFAVTVKAGLP